MDAKYFFLKNFTYLLNYGISGSICKVYLLTWKTGGMFRVLLNYVLVSGWTFPVLHTNMIPSISLNKISPTIWNFALISKGAANEQYHYHPLYIILIITEWLTSKLGFLSNMWFRVTSFMHHACPSYLSMLPWKGLNGLLFNTVTWNKLEEHSNHECCLQLSE